MNAETKVQQILAGPAPEGWLASGQTRDMYLDLMQVIVETAADWQDENGAIIDPVERIEHGQTSSRFVAPGAILLSAGRCEQLREKVLRGMDWCCMRLATGRASAADFWMRELMTAWNLLSADPARRAQWEQHIRAVDPESVYQSVSRDGSRLHELNNWTVYAAAGEALRELAALGPQNDDGSIVWGSRFFQKYMPAQLGHFSELGMYRDPNDPFTYDMTTRLQIATALHAGIQTPLAGELDGLLRRGALAQLLYVSPEGYAPFGGRSNQMHLQEAILAALCELEARRYRTSDPRLAGAFKRQARRHAKAISRWICGMQPIRHVKNGFEPATRHGCEDYAKWSVYSLFAASCLGLAWLFADDSIAEAPCPSELGGYALQLQPAFHKVFAVCGGTQLEIDTCADPHYDATGLGRFCHAGLPLELALAVPFAAHPSYRVPQELLPANDTAIGPGWKTGGVWTDLAELHTDLSASCTVVQETRQCVELLVQWKHASGAVVKQRYRLTSMKLEIRAEITSPAQIEAMRFTVPMLVTDGQTAAKISLGEGQASVRHPGGTYSVHFDPACGAVLAREIANRNGIYRPLMIEKPGNSIEVTLCFER